MDGGYERDKYTLGYEHGYSRGIVDGQRAFLDELARMKAISVKPIYFCEKCGKQILEQLNKKVEETNG